MKHKKVELSLSPELFNALKRGDIEDLIKLSKILEKIIEGKKEVKDK